MNDDIFYDLDPLFEGDEYNHRKVSNDQIPCMNNQNEEKKSTENDDKTMTIQENDVEVARWEIDLQNLKGGEMMVRKRKIEDFSSGSTNGALVETKINLRSIRTSGLRTPVSSLVVLGLSYYISRYYLIRLL